MSEDRDSFGRFLARPSCLSGYSNAGRRKRPTAFKHFKVDELLAASAEQREQYERLLADPSSTVRSLREWLLAQGHMVGCNAVSKHRLHWHAEFRMERRLRQTAASYCTLSRQFGPGAVAEANHAKVEMMLMQVLFNTPGGGGEDDEPVVAAPAVPPEQLQVLAKLAGQMVASRMSVEQMRGLIEDARQRAAEAAARDGATPATMAQIVDRVREILG